MTLTVPRRAAELVPTEPGIMDPVPFPDSSMVGPDQALAVACHALEYDSPTYSARTVLARWQRVTLVLVVLVTVLGLIFATRITGIVLVTSAIVAYLWALLFRLVIFQRGARGGYMMRISDEEAFSIPDAALPTYTVLVPAFKEPLVGELVEALEQIDYPRNKLDIRLLLEASDTETIAAARTLRPRPHLTIIVVPKADPQTKPKACNYGLVTARGQLCTIFDAEDKPDPLQLRRAAVALHRLGPTYACIQARLGFYNSRQNLLTRWFTLDYGTWFANMLPGLVAIDAPIPLGGTSNHFRVSALKQVGAWDPWNVTEDADLGLRLRRAGYQVSVLDSTTLEEANPDPINWIRQRSRWYKGYLQTFLVHLRRPRIVARQLGWRAVTDMMIFVAGTPLLSALNGVFWLITLVWFTSKSTAVAALFPPGVYHLGLLCLLLGNLSIMYMNLYTARSMERPDLLLPALLAPGYWVLMWVAAVKAVVQLVRNPSYWEKTAHGLHQPSEQQAKKQEAQPALAPQSPTPRPQIGLQQPVGIPLSQPTFAPQQLTPEPVPAQPLSRVSTSQTTQARGPAR
jgi:glycosyltransferase